MGSPVLGGRFLLYRKSLSEQLERHLSPLFLDPSKDSAADGLEIRTVHEPCEARFFGDVYGVTDSIGQPVAGHRSAEEFYSLVISTVGGAVKGEPGEKVRLGRAVFQVAQDRRLCLSQDRIGVRSEAASS